MFLSCVIVAKNEERNIARCIESLLKHTEGVKGREILLVDSCSTDGTVEIAKQYPISIVQLGRDWQHSPSAGRFTGVNNVTGKYVLIIDGDMELRDGWIGPALKFMEEHPNTGSVVGKHLDVVLQKGNTYAAPQADIMTQGRTTAEEVDYVWGCSIFRREALLKVGNFHPYLRAEEEAEVSYRLKRQGFALYFFPGDAVYHYCISPTTNVVIQETIRRIKGNLWAGMGDMLSWSLRKGYYSIIWKRFRVYFGFQFFLLIILMGAICSLILKKYFLSVLFVSLFPSFIFFMCLKKKSVYRGLLSVVNIGIISINLVVGLFRKVKDISNYPTDVTWIKRV